jgi:hypothetical protein
MAAEGTGGAGQPPGGKMRWRRASGSGREVFAMQAFLMASLIALPTYILATSGEDLLMLVFVGVGCVAVAMMGWHYNGVHARVPVMPNIRAAWLAEIRNDVVDATLVAILQNNGAGLDALTAAAGLHGWTSIQTAVALNPQTPPTTRGSRMVPCCGPSCARPIRRRASPATSQGP